MVQNKEDSLNGVVSLGMNSKTDIECPQCGHDEAVVTHNGDGDEVFCCVECQKFWKVET